MHDGTTNIYVYSYLGRLGRTVIGRVYVDDLDDWDLNDKQFEWGSGGQVSGFTLAPNGEVSFFFGKSALRISVFTLFSLIRAAVSSFTCLEISRIHLLKHVALV